MTPLAPDFSNADVLDNRGPRAQSRGLSELALIALATALMSACGGDFIAPSNQTAAVPTTANATATGADLQISGSASTGSPDAGASFSYTFQVKNSGPETATSVTFTDALPIGTGYNYATANGQLSSCTVANMRVSCVLGSIAKGDQAIVVVNVTAPVTAGTFSNTGTVTSSVFDPQTSNNSVTVTAQVKTALAACTLPVGQTTLDGLVMLKFTDSLGLFENFTIAVGATTYTVITNFYDGSAPLTTVINVDCQQSPVQFVQVGNFVNVTGTVGGAILPGSTVATPVIYASVVQVLTHKDH